MKVIAMIAALILLNSCSFIEIVSSDDKKISKSEKQYALIDKSGRFNVVRKRGFSKKENSVVVKSEVLDSSGKALEKVITMSTPGVMGKSLNVLRPKISQYTTWLDGKKYLSRMKLNTRSQSLDIKLRSPESKWNGIRKIKLPKGTGVYCFYSQLVECVKTTSFFSQSLSKKAGVMNFHIIWEGYPYFQDQYIGVKDEPISKAKLVYNGISDEGLQRFSLRAGNQVIMYHLNGKFDLIKQFWVSQGFSMVEKN